MTSTAKTIIAVVVVVLLAGGYYYWSSTHSGPATSGMPGTTQSDTTALPSGSNNSDAALNQDMTSINGNIQTTNADSAAVDSSVNAQASDTGN